MRSKPSEHKADNNSIPLLLSLSHARNLRQNIILVRDGSQRPQNFRKVREEERNSWNLKLLAALGHSWSLVFAFSAVLWVPKPRDLRRVFQTIKQSSRLESNYEAMQQ